MNMDKGSFGPGQNLQLVALTNEELVKLYNDYEEGSEEFEQVRLEMVRRGYSFDNPNSPSHAAEQTSAIFDTPEQHNPAARKLRYSKGGSALWAVLYFVLGAGLFYILFFEIQNGEAKTATIIADSIAAFMVFNLGALVSGIRHLANRKSGLEEAIHPGFYQSILGVIWILMGCASLYYAVKLFIDLRKWDLEMALSAAVIPLFMVFICVAFAAAMLTLGRETGSK